MSVAVTGPYAGLLGLVFIGLNIRVIRNRTRAKVSLLDGGDEALRRALRVHGNFAEYVPFALLLMALAEIQGASGLYMHLLGTVLIVCRLSHAYAITAKTGRSPARVIGVVETFGVIIATAGHAIYRFAAAGV